jgi:ADP-ribose pyrophosphatase YjhB (NUDIX family)
VEPGESWAACAQREFVVETGLRATIAGLLAIYSDPVTQRHRYADGDECSSSASCLRARPTD